MPSRRPHTKSRLGCLTCKQRKVRCDQGRPVCWNCTRLEKTCSYPDIVVSESSRHASHVGEAIHPGDIELADLQSTISNESAQDLELLHQYSTRTGLTMTDEPSRQQVWQLNVPRHAFSHRFLLHGLLSLAALHRREDCPMSQRPYYVQLARKHHSQALSQYIPILQNINRENCHALFAFSTLIGALSYGLLQLSDDGHHPDEFIDGIIETFDLLKGSTIIAHQAHDWLHNGDLHLFMGVEQPPSVSSATPSTLGAKFALEALLGHVQTLSYVDSGESSTSEGTVVDSNHIYQSSIHALLNVLETSTADSPRINGVLAWPAMVDQSYINLLKVKDPIAMIILNHYGTALHGLQDVWWLGSVGARLQRAVEVTLDAEWRPYLTMQHWQVAKGSVLGKAPLVLR